MMTAGRKKGRGGEDYDESGHRAAHWIVRCDSSNDRPTTTC